MLASGRPGGSCPPTIAESSPSHIHDRRAPEGALRRQVASAGARRPGAVSQATLGRAELTRVVRALTRRPWSGSRALRGGATTSERAWRAPAPSSLARDRASGRRPNRWCACRLPACFVKRLPRWASSCRLSNTSKRCRGRSRLAVLPRASTRKRPLCRPRPREPFSSESPLR